MNSSGTRTGSKGRSRDVVLEVTGLRKSYGGVVAVNGLDATVNRGEITGLIGPNGSGKTTTFSMISGATRPDGGRVVLDGEDITSASMHRIANRGLLRTFQITRIFPQMTVIENLTVKRGARSVARETLVWELAETVGLHTVLDEYAGDLSFGQQKLLELVRTAALEPAVMLLDEPFAGVNETMERKLVDFIQHVRHERQCSFFLIDHEMRLIMELCDHIYVMSNGELICQGNAEIVQADPATMEAYFGKGYIAGARE